MTELIYRDIFIMKTPPCFYEWQENNLLLYVYVQPAAKKNKIVGLHAEQLKIVLTAPPLDGKANAALIQFFAKLFAVKQQQIEILQGEKSRHKRLKIAAVSHLPSELVALGLANIKI